MNYYTKQLQQVTGDYRKIKVTSDNGESNWLNINLESIEALQAFLDAEKNRILDESPACHMSYNRRRHNTGLALAKLTGIKRNSDDTTVFNTPIGTKTPIGLYETVKAILADNPESPRYDELFPNHKNT